MLAGAGQYFERVVGQDAEGTSEQCGWRHQRTVNHPWTAQPSKHRPISSHFHRR